MVIYNKRNIKEIMKVVNEFINTINKQLKELVDSRSKSIYEFSDISNISKTTLYHLGNEGNRPSIETILIILFSLEEPIDKFVEDCINRSPAAATLLNRIKQDIQLVEEKSQNSYVADSNLCDLYVHVTDEAGKLQNLTIQDYISTYYTPKNP